MVLYIKEYIRNGNKYSTIYSKINVITVTTKGMWYIITTAYGKFRKKYLFLDNEGRVEYNLTATEKKETLTELIRTISSELQALKSNPKYTKKGTLRIEYQNDILKTEARLKKFQTLDIPNSILFLEKFKNS